MGNFGNRSIKKLLVAGAVLAMLAPSAVLSQTNYYGAIAFSSSTGAHGYSYDYTSRREAENRALNECYNAGGSNCTIATWFRNACGALAVGQRNGWGGDWGENRRQAENKALNICYNNASGCQVVRWVCVTR